VATGGCKGCCGNGPVGLGIGAFLGPPIKRARIMLVLIGLLYAYTGFRTLDTVSELKKAVDGWSSADPSYDHFKSQVTLVYAITVGTLVAGVANIVLAVIAGKKTMFAFNVALGIFVVLSAAQAYASDGAVFTSIVFWINAIILGMGYQAARKAQQLRAQSR